MIDFRRFGKRYGDRVAVRDFSLSVGSGEVVALLGPNGSGKTTSLKAAAGLVRPSEGEVSLGMPPRPAREPGARRNISFLPQKVAFPEALTGLEVVDFHRRLRGLPADRSAWALDAVGLTQSAGRAVGTYSGGMVQRLGLAVAALADAPVLLLDEPTASLDPEGLIAARAIIGRRRAGGGAALFTSHQLADVEELADRVAVLVEGRLVAELTRAELVARLAAMGVLRVKLDRCPAGLLERLNDARWDGVTLVVPGTPDRRAQALEAVHASGAHIAAFASEEGRLEGLYRELVGSAP